jgi:phage terminase large subunit-like protein
MTRGAIRFLASSGVSGATPGRSIEYQYIAEHMRGLFDKLDIRQVGFDRWKFAHGNHPVLSMCAANAVVHQDPAGNLEPEHRAH